MISLNVTHPLSRGGIARSRRSYSLRGRDRPLAYEANSIFLLGLTRRLQDDWSTLMNSQRGIASCDASGREGSRPSRTFHGADRQFGSVRFSRTVVELKDAS